MFRVPRRRAYAVVSATVFPSGTSGNFASEHRGDSPLPVRHDTSATTNLRLFRARIGIVAFRAFGYADEFPGGQVASLRRSSRRLRNERGKVGLNFDVELSLVVPYIRFRAAPWNCVLNYRG